MTTRKQRAKLGPYSKVFRRGAVGELDARSREGRFVRDAERQLIEHVGGEPSMPERVLIGRTVKTMLRLQLLDERLEGGVEFNPSDERLYSALNNTLRLSLRELGIKGKAPAKAPSLAEIASRYAKA